MGYSGSVVKVFEPAVKVEQATGAVEERLDAPATKWPTIIGVFSLLYAIGGLGCQAFFGFVSVFFGEFMANLGGSDAELPMISKIIGGASAVILLVIGVMMLIGSINLMRRRRSGVALLRRWVVMRLLLVLVFFTITVLTAPLQMNFQRQMVEFGNDQWIDAGRPDLVQEFDDAALWKRTMYSTAGMFAAVSVYPVLLGLYIGRRKIDEEIRAWE